MEGQLSKWYEEPYVRQYFEKIKEQFFIEHTIQSEKLIESIEYGNNFGLIIFTKDVLKNKEIEFLKSHFIEQLLSIGYVIKSGNEKEFKLQASLKARINGLQLFGNISILTFPAELQILIKPYSGFEYNQALDREELVHLLFSC